MARLQTQAILPCWRMATRKPVKGKKNLRALFLSSKWENVLILPQSSEVVLFSLPNSYFPAFMGRMLQAQGNAAVTPPFLSPNFCFRKRITKLMKTQDLLELIHTLQGEGEESLLDFCPHRKLTYLTLKRMGRMRTHHSLQQTPSTSTHGKVWVILQTSMG